MNQQQQHAQYRLEADINDAVKIAVADAIKFDSADLTQAKYLIASQRRIVDAVMHQLRRNWRVSERARKSTSTGK